MALIGILLMIRTRLTDKRLSLPMSDHLVDKCLHTSSTQSSMISFSTGVIQTIMKMVYSRMIITPLRVSVIVIQSVRQKDKIIECNTKCDINYNIVSVGFLCFFGVILFRVI